MKGFFGTSVKDSRGMMAKIKIGNRTLFWVKLNGFQYHRRRRTQVHVPGAII